MLKIFFYLSILTFVSCASTTKNEVQKEKSQVVLDAKSKSILDRAHKDILNSASLDPETKDDFIALQYQTYAEAQEVNKELRKLKVLFFQSLTQKDFNEKKTNEIIRQLKKQNERKLDIMINAFYQAKKILGHENNLDQRHLLWIDELSPAMKF